MGAMMSSKELTPSSPPYSPPNPDSMEEDSNCSDAQSIDMSVDSTPPYSPGVNNKAEDEACIDSRYAALSIRSGATGWSAHEK